MRKLLFEMDSERTSNRYVRFGSELPSAQQRPDRWRARKLYTLDLWSPMLRMAGARRRGNSSLLVVYVDPCRVTGRKNRLIGD